MGWNGAQSGLNASLDSKYRETMEIRTKHVRAGFEAGLEGIKAMACMSLGLPPVR